MRSGIRVLLVLLVGLAPAGVAAGGPPVPEPGTGSIIAVGGLALGLLAGYRAWRSRRKDP